MSLRAALCLALILTVSGCENVAETQDRPPSAREFPRAERPVSSLGANAFSNEQTRDERREAEIVMDLAKVGGGMTVADIGAGAGYYTVRLAERVGPEGRVLAQDIDRAALKQLGDRVERERLDNVSIALGAEDNPDLPEDSFDRVFMIHMFHEVSEPYAFLWRLRSALRDDGRAVVVDTDRATDQHGIPPELLFCEFKSVGFRLVGFVRKPELAGYYAAFEPEGVRPEPDEIEPCGHSGGVENIPSA